MHAGGVSGGGGGYGKKDRDPLEVRQPISNIKKSLMLIYFGFPCNYCSWPQQYSQMSNCMKKFISQNSIKIPLCYLN